MVHPQTRVVQTTSSAPRTMSATTGLVASSTNASCRRRAPRRTGATRTNASRAPASCNEHPRICVPDAAVCDGELARRCNSQGTGMEAGGTDCSEQENTACWDGECRPIVCAGIAEGEYMCKEAVSQHCLNNGTALQIRECSGWQYCDESTGRCRARCTPGDTRCMMGARALCNSDGYYEVDAACDADELCVSGECTPIICERNEILLRRTSRLPLRK